MKGAGMGRVVEWNRKARVMYVQCRTRKGNLQAWRDKIGKADPECRKRGRYAETGKHVALVCTHGEQIGRRWETRERFSPISSCVDLCLVRWCFFFFCKGGVGAWRRIRG